MARQTPNSRLRVLIAEARWTGHALAEAVNVVGGEAGVPLRYDRSSVAHWLTGTRPPAHVRAFVAEALSRRLDRSVSVPDTGLDETAAASAAKPPALPSPPPDPAARLIALADAGRIRRPSLRGLAYDLAANRMPSFAALAAEPAARSGGSEAVSVGPDQVEEAQLMLSVFCDADTAFGGGGARRAVCAYLAHNVTPWLRARVRPRVRRQVLSVASKLSYLAGYMCFDGQMGGAAQSYYRIAAELSAEAAEPSGYATALRGMSLQAHVLGHHAEALQLAETAATAGRSVPAAHAAFLAGQVAMAAAATGGRQTALTHLDAAERFLCRADGPDEQIGSYHESALAYQRAEVLVSLGDLEGAVRALAAALRLRPAGERRARALIEARLAELHLRLGRLDQACAVWGRFCDDYPHLNSARADSALRLLRAQLRPYARNGAAHVLLDRAAELAPPGRTHR
jgi:tetratricopeptide (TPR) repeat protein